MNRAEAIEILKTWRENMANHGVPDFGEKYRALGVAIEALQDDWVPVSERLPEEYDQYLCYCEEGYYYVYWLENKPWAEETVEKEGIIAWQPLPEPYKGGDTE